MRRVDIDDDAGQLPPHHRVDPANLAPAAPVDRLSPSTLNAAINVGFAQNPSVTAALSGVDVAQLQVKIAEGALWPTLGLQGSIQQQTFPNILTQNLFTATGQLNLSVPVYQGGAEYSAIRLDKDNVGRQRLNAQHLSKAATPLITTTGLLLHRYRFDLAEQHIGNGNQTTVLDGGKGLDLIVSDRTEIQGCHAAI